MSILVDQRVIAIEEHYRAFGRDFTVFDVAH